jgi:aerobic-type carbon monoxide dehydrogenase small subunit (CoxS/CutS family)
MNDIRGPGELNFESTNLSEAWAKWERSMQYYLVVRCKDRSEDEKVAIFMCMIGRQGQDIRDTFELDEDKDGEEIMTVEILIQKFEQYCKPNLIVERHRFLTRNQEQSETIDQYVTELKTLATSCECGDFKDDLRWLNTLFSQRSKS